MKTHYRLIYWMILTGTILMLGVTLADDFGQSWDVHGDDIYGMQVLKAYLGAADYEEYGELVYYGPAYFMLSSVSSRAIAGIIPTWIPLYGRYLTNYLSFVLCVLALVSLCLRFVSGRTAILVGLLFATQPLLFGHAFINDKDIPFLAFFLTSVAFGWWTIDRWMIYTEGRRTNKMHPSAPEKAFQRWYAVGKARWEAKAAWLKWLTLGAILLIGVSILDFFVLGFTVELGKTVISKGLSATAWTPINSLFEGFTPNTEMNVESSIIERFELAFNWIRVFIPTLALTFVILINQLFTHTSEKTIDQEGLIVSSQIFLSGVLLGITMAIRVAGPFAGLLVMVYWIFRAKRKAMGPIMAYSSIAIIVMYLLWPAIWIDPVRQGWDAIRLMSNFPSRRVLFDGQLLGSRSLPWHYFPSLLSKQLTEPLVLGGIIGLVLVFLRWKRSKWPTIEISLVIAWLMGPALLIALFRPSIYGNFRQLFFLLPPLLVLAGIAMESLLQILKKPILKFGASLVIILPGVVGISSLHPYEYVYYNSLAKGVAGTSSEYELDYWCIGYREVMEVINLHAAPGSRVAVWGPVQAAKTFARDDLLVMSEEEIGPNPEYAIACGHFTQAEDYYQTMRVFYRVERNGMIMAIIKTSIQDP